ncbi:MAG: chaperone HscA [Actinomycetales bacterium]|nr:MAG: chaperone HscA [Actinomycetales bacterium]
MPIGVDFGTTRTIVAFGDRGNYPVVAFTDDDGDAHEFFPSVVARGPDGLLFGFAALSAARAGAPTIRSFKRALADPGTSPQTTIRVGDLEVTLVDLLAGFFEALLTALRTASNAADFALGDPPEAVVSVPAHAHGAQRFLTLEAFRRAGFTVVSMINEPSAAGFEFTHRQAKALTSRRNRVLVYDLGGGTFDASVVQVEGTGHTVVTSLGINRLGGDDIDEALADLVIHAAGVAPGSLSGTEATALVDECRDAKERLAPQTKRITVDVAGQLVTVSVDDFYAAVTPLIERSVGVMGPLVAALGEEGADLGTVAGLYLVGGSSSLPLVPRLLRARYGRRVHRSPYPAASTAIGLAIAADTSAGYSLTDRLSRGFGVFRERDGGRAIGFDEIFGPDLTVVPGERVTVTRRYRAAHNVGWFRFVEYAAIDQQGDPKGDLTPFAEVLFPFDPQVQGQSATTRGTATRKAAAQTAARIDRLLSGIPVERRDDGPLVEESYTVDEHGIIEVTLRDLDTGYEQVCAVRA